MNAEGNNIISLNDIQEIARSFCKKTRHGTIRLDVRNHEIKGVHLSKTEFVKLPLAEKRTD